MQKFCWKALRKEEVFEIWDVDHLKIACKSESLLRSSQILFTVYLQIFQTVFLYLGQHTCKFLDWNTQYYAHNGWRTTRGASWSDKRDVVLKFRSALLITALAAIIFWLTPGIRLMTELEIYRDLGVTFVSISPFFRFWDAEMLLSFAASKTSRYFYTNLLAMQKCTYV